MPRPATVHREITACRACAQICPDFVFQVYRYAVPVEAPTGGPAPTGPRPGART